MFLRLVMAASIGVGAVLSASTQTTQAAEKWTCNIFVGPKHYVNKALKTWRKAVQKSTNGELKINYLPTSAAPPPKQIDGIAAGTFDCAFIFHAFTAKRAVGPGFGILPFLSGAKNTVQSSVAYHRTWAKHFEGKGEFKDDGVKILGMYQFPGVHFTTAKDKPINSMADLKSMRMWALAGTSSKTLKAAGINHVSGPAARVAEFTQTKVVQGIAGATRGGVVNFIGLQFPKSYTYTSRSLMMPSFAWMVSLKKWDALSAENKKKVLAESGEKLARAVGVASDNFERVAKGKMDKAGIKFVKASAKFEADLKKVASPQVNAWIKRAGSVGVDGNQVLKDFDDAVKSIN